MRPAISLIFPAYNEAARIAGTVGEAVCYFESRGRSYEILVPADGDDGTREIVAEMARSNAALASFGSPERRGKGRGIREAVERATGQVIGFADADNKVPVEELDKFWPHLDRGCTAVIGSRALAMSRIERRQPLYRQLGSKVFKFAMENITGLRGISDTQCGFKFFQHDAAKELFRRQRVDGYMYDVEILILAQRAGMDLTEVPIRWRDDGDSRLDLVRGTLRNARDILRISVATRSMPRSEWRRDRASSSSR